MRSITFTVPDELDDVMREAWAGKDLGIPLDPITDTNRVSFVLGVLAGAFADAGDQQLADRLYDVNRALFDGTVKH